MEGGMTLGMFCLQLIVNLMSLSATENIILGKPSSDSKGNDDTVSTCFHMEDASQLYWQVDLQEYYSINDVTVVTCFGQWGYRAKNAEITGYQRNPESCSGVRNCLIGKTPSGTGESQTRQFTSACPFRVRYLRVSATTQDWVSMAEVRATANSSSSMSSAKFTYAASRKLLSPDDVKTVASKRECAEACATRNDCLGFSYSSSDPENNCQISADVSVAQEPDWLTGYLDPCFELPNAC